MTLTPTVLHARIAGEDAFTTCPHGRGDPWITSVFDTPAADAEPQMFEQRVTINCLLCGDPLTVNLMWEAVPA